MPEFSILLPVSDHVRPVREAIDSVLRQTYPDFELIVVAPGSSDEERDAITSCRDPRVIPIRSEGGPLSRSLGHALHEAGGTWVASLTAGQRFLPDTLARVHEALQNDPAIDLLGVRLRTVGADGLPADDQPAGHRVSTRQDLNDPAAWIWHNPLPACVFIRRSTLIDLGGYGDLDTIVHWDLGVRALVAGARIEVLPEVPLEWRDGSNLTRSPDLATIRHYAVLSQRTVHPYLREIGRADLVALNITGFLADEALASAGADERTTVLGTVLAGASPGELERAVLPVTDELLRLRESHTRTAASTSRLSDRVTELTERLSEREYELGALADRLYTAESERRRAQGELDAIRDRKAYRAARKMVRLARRRPS